MSTPTTPVLERVLTVLGEGPATAREIGEKIGLTALAVRPVLNDLQRHGKVQNDKGWLKGHASTWSRRDA